MKQHSSKKSCPPRSFWTGLVLCASSAFAQDDALYLEGNLFVQSNLGAIELGFPNNGNQWRIATSGGGQDLVFQQKLDGFSTFRTLYHLDGQVGYFGIGGEPTARAQIFQQGQSVGLGLRFTDGTANEDWDITHGFGLRLHYGGSLRGFFNANTGDYTVSSDKRLKEAAQPLPSVLSRMSQLEPLTYQYIDDPTGQQAIGFMAQDVLPLFPSLVSYSEADDLYGINYAGFSVVAIKAVQELQQQVEERDDQILELMQRIEAIEYRLNCENPLRNDAIDCGALSYTED